MRIPYSRWLPACCLALGACASAPPPVAEIAAARTAVSEAQPAASRHAPAELQAAVSKLQLAEAAFARDDFVLARRAAEQAQADARLAAARAEDERMRQAVVQVNLGIDTLKEQLERRGQ